MNNICAERKGFNPQISVVTVCYNAVESIEKTILSVINQTYPNIEYIIIDGASTDGTIDVLNKYRDKISCIISEPDKGIYDAMNKALKVSSGVYLIFMGADDVFYGDNVLSDCSAFMKDESKVYYGNVFLLEQNKIFNGKFNKYKWSIFNVCHQSIFYPKTIYKVKEYDTRYVVYADYAYNLTLLSEGVEFMYMDTIISKYSTSGFSSYTKDEFFSKDKLRLVYNAYGVIPSILVLLYKIYWLVYKSHKVNRNK